MSPRDWGASRSPAVARGLGSGLAPRTESLKGLFLGNPWNHWVPRVSPAGRGPQVDQGPPAATTPSRPGSQRRSKAVPFQKILSFPPTPASEQAGFVQGGLGTWPRLPLVVSGSASPWRSRGPREPGRESGFSALLPGGTPAGGRGEQSQPVVATTPPSCGFIKAFQRGPVFSVMFHMPWRRACMARLLGTGIRLHPSPSVIRCVIVLPSTNGRKTPPAKPDSVSSQRCPSVPIGRVLGTYSNLGSFRNLCCRHSRKTQNGSEARWRRFSPDLSVGVPPFGASLFGGLEFVFSCPLCRQRRGRHRMASGSCVAPGFLRFCRLCRQRVLDLSGSGQRRVRSRNRARAARQTALGSCCGRKLRGGLAHSRPRRVHGCEAGDPHVSRSVSEVL